MAGRRTNLALLALLPLAALSGALAFVVGSGPVRPVLVLHGVVGLGLLVLLPWKSVIARRGLRRRRPGRSTSVLLAVLVLLALLTGLAHATGVLVAAGGLSALQVHVGAALGALALAAAHVRRRRARPRGTDLSRRALLGSALVAAAAAAAYLAVEGTTRVLALPGARRRATGSYQVAATEPAAVPVTSWLFDRVPDLDPATWRLVVGSGSAERRWSLAELAGVDDRVTAVLDCTGGWWCRQEWSGVRLSRLLPPGATGSVGVESATGYRRRLPLTDDLLLAVAVAGSPLTAGHGAPVRLVVPGRRGYHWVKWVVRIEHDHEPWWVQPPLPLR